MNKTRCIFLLLVLVGATNLTYAGRIEQYVDSPATWLSDRLQMHWQTHADTTYIRGEYYDHLGQHAALVPTVCLAGTRSHVTNYRRPTLEELSPRCEDIRGMWLFNNVTKQYKFAPICETGNIILSINQEIASLALQAAKKGQAPYSDIARNILHTYMYGIRYTQMPQDLTHGHIQTLVGLQSFEVIHENTLPLMAEIYNLLIPIDGRDTCIENAFRHWADIIIANGVPHNNWNIIQARFILAAASTLQSDTAYADRHGLQYYIDVVLHRDFVRQWSLKTLAQRGFDQSNGIWHECAGYSLVVLDEYDKARELLLQLTGNDLYDELPILLKARANACQYLFPDGLTIGFGDTHPSPLTPNHSSLTPNPSTLFYAPESSWLVARTGMSKDTSLAFALNGSLGNHQHANGISLELYGCGLRLAPDAGIGYSLYSGDDYKEYYSRFPAHNTVCVDGVSDYPVMMSQHAFTLLDSASNPNGFTFAEVEFLEPETQAIQRRLVVMTPRYFVDIFRSRRQDGKDQFHDYFYHNLGQEIYEDGFLTGETHGRGGTVLSGTPSSDMAFAGGHLYAYSYLYNVQQIFDSLPFSEGQGVGICYSINGDSILMHQWSMLQPNRNYYRALAPSTEGLSRAKNMPYDMRNTPTLTYIERQFGEAWTRPFVHVFQPSTRNSKSATCQVSFPKLQILDKSTTGAVAVCITHENGKRELIISTDNPSARVRVFGKTYYGRINCVTL